MRELFVKPTRSLRDDRVFTICISTSGNLPNLSTCAGMWAGVAGSDDQSVFLLVFLVFLVFLLLAVSVSVSAFVFLLFSHLFVVGIV